MELLTTSTRRPLMSRSHAARSLCLVLLATATTIASGQGSSCPTPDFMTRADIRGLGLADVDPEGTEVSVFGFAV